jgi:hypothetical protein
MQKSIKGKERRRRLKKRPATKWELWEYVKATEREDDFLHFQGTMDFIRSKDENIEINGKKKKRKRNL